MRRRNSSIVVCATAVAVITSLWAPAASAAPGDGHGRLLDTVAVSAARPAASVTAPVPAASAQKCTPAPGKTTFCVRTDPAALQTERRPSARDAATCAVTGPVEMRYHRFGSCLKTAVTGTLINDKGVPVGTGTLSMVHSVTLSATSSAFTEQTTVTLSNVTGQVTQVAVSLTGSCTNGCVATTPSPWTGAAA